MRTTLALAALVLALGTTATAEAQATCWIFVHGRQSDTNTLTSYTAARNYWVQGTSDGVRTITNNFADRFYVVGYNGTEAWHLAAWNNGVGEVTRELLAATSGQPDAGGNSCGTATTFNVVAHSMGNSVTDFILGNFRTTDADYRAEYATIRSRVARVVSMAGAHRGSQLADAACWTHSNFLCNGAGTFSSCDSAVSWLQTSSSYEVRTYANAPGNVVWLFGGWEGGVTSGCLAGEDDYVLQYASLFACSSSATGDFNTSNVCLNGAKSETGGMFLNGDQSYEEHGQLAAGSSPDQRRAIGDGVWNCGTTRCTTNTIVQSSMTAPTLVNMLW